MSTIAICSGVTASSMAHVAALIESGEYQQVGVIRTQYKEMRGDVPVYTGRSMEAVIRSVEDGSFLAVEQHRGVAIMAEVQDEEMLAAFEQYHQENGYTPGEGFVYDQEVVKGVTDCTVPGLDVSDIPALTGEEGL